MDPRSQNLETPKYFFGQLESVNFPFQKIVSKLSPFIRGHEEPWERAKKSVSASADHVHFCGRSQPGQTPKMAQNGPFSGTPRTQNVSRSRHAHLPELLMRCASRLAPQNAFPIFILGSGKRGQKSSPVQPATLTTFGPKMVKMRARFRPSHNSFMSRN